ncbi:hypothetical protein ABIC94_003931 [Variovorax paradoxus]|uniref:hypothetical protein n=1 Tax=Variovorax paradoxus TaxID=34073 RepID=UPI003396B9CC
MVIVLRFLAALLLLCASAANALVPTVSEWTYNGAPAVNGQPQYWPTSGEACNHRLQALKTQYPGSASQLTIAFCTEHSATTGSMQTNLNGSAFESRALTGRGANCPANSTAVTGGCQCNSGYKESGGQCVPDVNQCTPNAGKVQITNWTVGFFRTPDDNDFSAVGPVNKLPTSGSFCSGGCKMNVPDAGAPGWAAWRSQSPNAQGLYRGSLDVPAVNSGTECTAGSADTPLSPVAVEPACPGAVGEVNGKLGCYGTAQNPVTTTPSDRPPVPPIAGNPTAGAKPATGEGSGTGSAGRTPSTGNGGNGGGPAAAGQGGKGGSAGGTATGTGSSGTGEDEKPDPCGAPGQPECNVKVNEKGTPESAGTTYETAKTKLDETKTKNDEQLAKAAGQGDKGFLEPVRSMFWAPPIAACEPMGLPGRFNGLTVDACGVVDGGRALMGFIWAAGGLFLCLGMVKRSI